MIIELYGLPGSGKSTLAKQLVNLDSSFVLVDFSNKLERYFYLLLYIITNPLNFWYWFIFLLKNKKLFIYKLHLLSLAMAKMQKAKTIKDKKVLIDEGLLQRVITIADCKIGDGLLNKILKHLDGLGYLIIMEGASFYRFKNDKQKNNSPRIKLGQNYFENWQILLEKNHKLIKEYIVSKQNLKTHIYNKEIEEINKVALDLVD